MDQDFIAELDAALSNVGSDVVWRRIIGDVELWISPLQLIGQEKVAEVITKLELGANIVYESKRMTLAHSIVGIGEHDLRQYRGGGGSAIFPITGKDGKPIKTTLDKYLYHKLGSWGAEFINDVFAIYADLMESYQRENLKNIKFENAKEPREELAELQARVYELRQQLDLPPLIEGSEPADEDLTATEDLETIPEEPEDSQQAPFDPFSTKPQFSNRAPPAAPEVPPQITAPSTPVPSGTVAQQRAQEAAEIEGSFPNTNQTQPPTPPIPPIQDMPPRPDVVDRPASREPVAPPVIDRTNVSRNPRFKPTR